jgi:hypothetical protein
MNRLSHLFGDDSSLESLVRRFCTLPDPLVSYEEAERRAHRDLDAVGATELRQEREALRIWLRLVRSPHPWFLERLRQLNERLGHVR